jgi:hypothetical protein
VGVEQVSSKFVPGDLIRIETSEPSVLEVISVNGESPYVRFDWDFPWCPLDLPEDEK